MMGLSWEILKMPFIRLVAALTCSVIVSSCSIADGTSTGDSVRHVAVSRPEAGAHIGLTPSMDGGSAGWCFAKMIYGSSKGGNETTCSGARTSTGPIVVESCNAESGPDAVAYVSVLARSDVAEVTVAGGMPIPTESNAMLPAGLRSAAIELPGYRIVPKGFTVGYPWRPCPVVTAVDASGKPIQGHGTSGSSMVVKLPARGFRPPTRQPNGACRLGVTQLPRETVVSEGSVAVQIMPIPKLLGQAFISCVETSYLYMGGHEIPAAVLLSAEHPGSTPPGLPGMKPLAGHPSIFEAPPNLLARRAHNAWLVVHEEDNIGPRVPLELLERLRVTIRQRRLG